MSIVGRRLDLSNEEQLQETLSLSQDENTNNAVDNNAGNMESDNNVSQSWY